jgi:hypothetical protein
VRAFGAEHEARRSEQRDERGTHAHVPGLIVRAQGEQPLELGIARRPAPYRACERAHRVARVGVLGLEPALERRRLRRSERTDELEARDPEVAVAPRRVGVLGLVVVVDEGHGERVLARLERDARLVGPRVGRRGVDVEALELLAVEGEVHARRLVARLLCRRRHAEEVVAAVAHRDARDEPAVRREHAEVVALSRLG